jgi:hypothetical protein
VEAAEFVGRDFAKAVRELIKTWPDGAIEDFTYNWTGPQKASLTKNLPKLRAKLDALTPPQPSSRASDWANAAADAQDALDRLIELQSQFEDWRSNLPDNLQDRPTAEKLDAVCDLDLQSALDAVNEAAGVELPMGFGRD